MADKSRCRKFPEMCSEGTRGQACSDVQIDTHGCQKTKSPKREFCFLLRTVTTATAAPEVDTNDGVSGPEDTND